jgi:hypothetical protein
MGDVCEKCGSDKLIDNLPLQDRMHDFGMMVGQASVSVEGNPSARFFKEAVQGSVSLRLCCACGRAEIRVSNGESLWDTYQKVKRESLDV